MLYMKDLVKLHIAGSTGRAHVFSIAWSAGVLASFLLLYTAQPATVSWMRAWPGATVSIVGALFSYCLPLLIIAICLWLDHIIVASLYILLRGFSQGYSAVICALAYGASGWLVWLLVNFSGICITVLTIYMLYKLSHSAMGLKKLAVMYSFAAVAIASINALLIKPYLTVLFV